MKHLFSILKSVTKFQYVTIVTARVNFDHFCQYFYYIFKIKLETPAIIAFEKCYSLGKTLATPSTKQEFDQIYMSYGRLFILNKLF